MPSIFKRQALRSCLHRFKFQLLKAGDWHEPKNNCSSDFPVYIRCGHPFVILINELSQVFLPFAFANCTKQMQRLAII